MPTIAIVGRPAMGVSGAVGVRRMTGSRRNAVRSVLPLIRRVRHVKLEARVNPDRRRPSSRGSRDTPVRQHRADQQGRDQSEEDGHVQVQRGVWAALCSGRAISSASLSKNSSSKWGMFISISD